MEDALYSAGIRVGGAEEACSLFEELCGMVLESLDGAGKERFFTVVANKIGEVEASVEDFGWDGI